MSRRAHNLRLAPVLCSARPPRQPHALLYTQYIPTPPTHLATRTLPRPKTPPNPQVKTRVRAAPPLWNSGLQSTWESVGNPVTDEGVTDPFEAPKVAPAPPAPPAARSKANAGNRKSKAGVAVSEAVVQDFDSAEALAVNPLLDVSRAARSRGGGAARPSQGFCRGRAAGDSNGAEHSAGAKAAAPGAMLVARAACRRAPPQRIEVAQRAP